MACGCKGNNSGGGPSTKKNFTNNILFKLVMFLISIPILTILYPFVVVILFRTIVLDNNVANPSGFLLKFAKKVRGEKDKEEEEEDEESNGEINPDDYELEEKVDVIK